VNFPKGVIPSPASSLLVAAGLTIGSSLIFFVTNSPTGLNFLQLGVSVLLGVLLLRASRIAWVLTLLGSVAQLASPLWESQPLWSPILAGALALSLVLPQSTRQVWRARLPTGPAYAFVARLAQWEAGPSTTPRSYGVLLWRLGGAMIVLSICGAMLHGGQESWIVSVMSSVVWTAFAFTQLAFFIALLAAAITFIGRKMRAEPSDSSA
jgi:hypothetical protein